LKSLHSVEISRQAKQVLMDGQQTMSGWNTMMDDWQRTAGQTTGKTLCLCLCLLLELAWKYHTIPT